MYLSRVELNVGLAKTMKALENPGILHGAVERSFEGERARRLWRIDSLNEKKYVLIVSEDTPDLENFAQQFGYPNGYETKDYSPLLNRMANGRTWRFRLVANPTVARGVGGSPSKKLAHTTPLYQKQWLMDRAERGGFAVSEDNFQVVGSRWYRFYKKQDARSAMVQLLSVTFEGVLTVTDAATFRHTLCNGIGREKAYGQGMLTVVRV